MPQILFQDPDWFFHAFDDGAFKERQALRPEAEDINFKAQRIRIPDNPDGQLVVAHYVDKMTGAISHFGFVPRDRPIRDGPTWVFRCPTINMRAPRAVREYFKIGYQESIRLLKHYLFGKPTARISKGRAEQYFGNLTNFDFEVSSD